MKKSNYSEYVLKVAGREIVIVSHARKHLEEMVAITSLQIGADEKFLDKYAPDGKIYLGTGADIVGEDRAFDEHPYPEKGIKAKEGETALTLLLKALPRDLLKIPSYKNLVVYAVAVDKNPDKKPDNLAPFLNDMYMFFQEEEVIEFALQALLWKFKEDANSHKLDNFSIEYIWHHGKRISDSCVVEQWYQKVKEVRIRKKELWVEAVKEYLKKAERRETQVVYEGEEKKIFFAYIISDNPLMKKVPYSNEAKMAGKFAHVTIIQNSSGNTQIFSNIWWLSCKYITAFIRQAELRQKGITVDIQDPMLYERGATAGTSEWFYPERGEMLLNGSLTHPDVPPSAISFLQKADIIERAIKYTYQ